MGSLYDIGNMRYKHFTFYSRGEAGEYTPPSAEYVPDPNKTAEENTTLAAAHEVAFKNLIAQLESFLSKVWPRDAIYGYNAEDDTAYITYIKQGADGVVLIENIYTFRRSTVAVGDGTGATTQRWMLAINPTKSVNPQDFINQEGTI